MNVGEKPPPSQELKVGQCIGPYILKTLIPSLMCPCGTILDQIPLVPEKTTCVPRHPASDYSDDSCLVLYLILTMVSESIPKVSEEIH